MSPHPPHQLAHVLIRPCTQLAAVVAAFVLLGIGYARVTPPWNNPDEPAHYAYVEHLAVGGSLPELRAGDWDAAALERLKEVARFRPERADLDGARYEYHQPPLYYLTLAPAFRLTEHLSLAQRVSALRAVSLLLGALTLVVIYRAARLVTPRSPHVWAGSAGIAAFVPMFTSISVAINNDALAVLLGSCAVWLMLLLVKETATQRRAMLCGLLIGGLLLTKLTVYVFAPLVLGALVYSAARQGRQYAVRSLAIALLVALAVAGWWFARNAAAYGAADLLITVRHDQVVLGQPRWSDLALSPVASAWEFGRTLFRSFWAQFGWMSIVVSDAIYALYVILTAVGAAAGIRGVVRASRAPLKARPASVVLAASLLGVAGGIAYYNLTFVQPQGRYLFPALLPLAVLLAVAWSTLATTRGHLWPARFGRALTWAWTAAAVTLAGSYFLSPHAEDGRFVVPLLVALAVGAAALWGRLRPPDPLALPALTVGLAMLDAACLVGFVARYYAG